MDEGDPGREKARLTELAAAYQSDAAAASISEAEANAQVAESAVEWVTGPRVLVLGAATGCWAEPLLARFSEFDCVDAVEALVDDLVRRYSGRVRGHAALFEEFEPEARFDSVILGHVLEHVTDPVAILRRVSDWLAPEGRVVITVPNATSLHRLVGVELGMLSSPSDFSPADEALGHRRVYDRDTLRADVEAAELSLLHQGGLLLKPLSNTQMDQWNADLRRAYFALGAQHPAIACVLLAVATASPSAAGAQPSSP